MSIQSYNDYIVATVNKQINTQLGSLGTTINNAVIDQINTSITEYNTPGSTQNVQLVNQFIDMVSMILQNNLNNTTNNVYDISNFQEALNTYIDTRIDTLTYSTGSTGPNGISLLLNNIITSVSNLLGNNDTFNSYMNLVLIEYINSNPTMATALNTKIINLVNNNSNINSLIMNTINTRLNQELGIDIQTSLKNIITQQSIGIIPRLIEAIINIKLLVPDIVFLQLMATDLYGIPLGAVPKTSPTLSGTISGTVNNNAISTGYITGNFTTTTTTINGISTTTLNGTIQGTTTNVINGIVTGSLSGKITNTTNTLLSQITGTITNGVVAPVPPVLNGTPSSSYINGIISGTVTPALTETYLFTEITGTINFTITDSSTGQNLGTITGFLNGVDMVQIPGDTDFQNYYNIIGNLIANNYVQYDGSTTIILPPSSPIKLSTVVNINEPIQPLISYVFLFDLLIDNDQINLQTYGETANLFIILVDTINTIFGPTVDIQVENNTTMNIITQDNLNTIFTALWNFKRYITLRYSNYKLQSITPIPNGTVYTSDSQTLDLLYSIIKMYIDDKINYNMTQVTLYTTLAGSNLINYELQQFKRSVIKLINDR